VTARVALRSSLSRRGGSDEKSHRHRGNLLPGARSRQVARLVQEASRNTIWSVGAAGGDHFAPSTSTFMVNYRVDNLAALLQALREEGCNVLEKTDDSEYGKFGWVLDPEGNKVELWQPPEGQ
jgi:uncharacterized glyoxalase superfamily protein PhnB